MTQRDELHLLTGAYALGALNEKDTAQFEAYLAESESLRSEVAEMTDTAVVLGLATTPVTPSADLKARIMGLVATTPQLPALDADAQHAVDQRAQSTTVSHLTAVPAAAESTHADAAHSTDTDSTDTDSTDPATTHPATTASARGGTHSAAASDRARTRWFTRPVGILTAAAAAVALFVGGGIVSQALLDGNDTLRQEQAAGLAELNAAPDLQRASADVEGGSTATLIWSGELNRSAVVFDELEQLPGDRVYQAWYINASNEATPAGTFEADGDRTSFRVLEGSMESGTVVGVTVEPEGGSEQPTTNPIVVIEAA